MNIIHVSISDFSINFHNRPLFHPSMTLSLSGGDPLALLKNIFNRANNRQATTPDTSNQTATDGNTPPAPTPQPVADTAAFPPSKSLLFSLWQDWNATQTVSQSIDAMLMNPEFDPTPISREELMSERSRASFRLMSIAKTRHKLAHPQEGEPEPVDAEIFLHVAAKRMGAWILVFPPLNGGNPIHVDDLLEVLRQEQITTGIDMPALQNIAVDLVYFRMIPVAKGKLPGAPIDGKVVEDLPRSHQSRSPGQNGKFYYYQKNHFQYVEEEAQSAHAVPPKRGPSGVDIQGTEILGEMGQVVLPEGGENTMVTEDGRLIATREGKLVFDREKQLFCVQPYCVIDGTLDGPDNNITRESDVLVFGDVCAPASIQTTGSITIEGLVEAAILEADGDISISAGVLGDNRTLIRSKGNVSAKYMENCVVYAGGSVTTECIIRSHIYSDDRITVTHGRGKIIGGKLTAANQIEAKTIGSMAEHLIEINLGLITSAQLEQQALSEQLKSLQAEYDRVVEDVELLESEENNKAGASLQLGKSRLRRAALAVQVEQMKHRMDAISIYCEDFTACRLIATTLYPKIHVTIQEFEHTIMDDHSPCTVRVDAEGEFYINWTHIQ